MRIAPALFALAFCAPLLPALAAADPNDAFEEVGIAELELGRDAAELQDQLRYGPPDRDSVDSALVFTNRTPRSAGVRCVAYDDDGRPVGRFRVKVPGMGLRFALASEIAAGRDFTGSARCGTRGHVIGSAFLLAPGGIADLPSLGGFPQAWPAPLQAAEATLERPEAAEIDAIRPIPRPRKTHIAFPVVATF